MALKVMRAWAWSGAARRRFELEIEALARLTHPNIARLYDAGTLEQPSPGHEQRKRRGARGPVAAILLPYFVMEFIPEARSIREYAAEHNLGIRERLELFLAVCDAVQHGHQKSIIHRDLKPSNILVDAAGMVKVIDFGVAKATDSDLAATTPTDAGQLAGTVQYMSPEQCIGNPHDVDTRTDVYSLGVVLYELLCGVMPYGVFAPQRAQSTQRENGDHEALIESEDPPCTAPASPVPSVVKTPSNLYGIIKAICEFLPMPPRLLNREVSKDLEFVLLKALEKDRLNRYQSVADLREICGIA